MASFSLSGRRAAPHARSSVSANGRFGRYSECGQVRTWAHSEGGREGGREGREGREGRGGEGRGGEGRGGQGRAGQGMAGQGRGGQGRGGEGTVHTFHKPEHL